ncbi:MAG: N-acetylglucosamine-6-phosphate deacetylase [Elusimicrobiota bacterium]|jgi:N-acetylglucosamine-6-phosphate deacetylase|nr:N-acetylglucosamine-6-phosphate deacetylase [Elusimicrobiota bacterium]
MKTLYHNCKIVSKGQVYDGGALVSDGVIERVLRGQCGGIAADEKIDLNGAYLAPGFIDTHIHGCGGFGTDNKSADDILAMSELLIKQGVVAFAPTIYPAELAQMLETLKKLAPAVGRERGAKILGFHMEGPFISPAKPGVMKPESIQPVNLDSAQKIYEASGGHIVAMTAAPELENIDKLAAFAAANNFILQAGHTNATYEETLRAADFGVKHATHLFNAMSALNHRSLGAPGAILSDGRFSAEIIADGVHLAPAIVKIILMLKGPDKAVLITDSLTPTGRGEGRANGEEVKLEGGVFRRKADGVIAGSALTMLEGVRNLVKWGCPLAIASMAAGDNPAALYGLDFGILEEGKAARLVALDQNLNLQKVIF